MMDTQRSPVHENADYSGPGNPARAEELIDPNHSHTAIMAKTDQNDAAARGILNVYPHADTLQSRSARTVQIEDLFPRTTEPSKKRRHFK